MAATAYGIKPLSIPGGSPAGAGASPMPLMQAATKVEPKAVRINRRGGARKTSRMAFTPPQKSTAFKTD